jgi:serine/threonine protein kinase
MGEVYRARDSRLGRDVALKVLPAAYVSDSDRRARFLREARAAAALDHPNIISIHDVSADADAPFIVSELLDGTTLRDRLASGVGWSARKALEVAIPIARGLAAAHAHGIVHRDLKPENVFLSDTAGVKILDFGLARVAPEARSNGISATSTNQGRCSAPSGTWRRSRSVGSTPTTAPTSLRSGRFCTRCSPDAGRTSATRQPTP